jgi:mRNA-degrading endonuclease RelE of RelBE toxin-antitoxin system
VEGEVKTDLQQVLEEVVEGEDPRDYLLVSILLYKYRIHYFYKLELGDYRVLVDQLVVVEVPEVLRISQYDLILLQ